MDIWSAVDIGATFGLGAWGAYMTLRPLKDGTPDHKVNRVLAVFMILALASVAAKYQQDAALETKITGGDSYCFISVGGTTPTGEALVTLANTTGPIPYVRWGFYQLQDGNKVPLDNWSSPQPCLKTTVLLRQPRAEGEYVIDFNGSNGVWSSWLTLKRDGDTLVETRRVVRDDGTVLSPEQSFSHRIAGR